MKHFESRFCGLALLASLLGGGILWGDPIYSPLAWSRSGGELAFLVQGGDEEKIFSKGWIWGFSRPDVEEKGGEIRRELWVRETAHGREVRVEATAGWLSAPAWTASGDAVTYVHIAPSQEGKARVELVRRYPDGKRDVLFEETVVPGERFGEELALFACAWSSDGRYVAFPWPVEATLRVLDVERGEVVASFAGGSLPSWSPTGKWLVFYRAGEGHGFRAVQGGIWSESAEKVTAAGDQAVLWDPGEEAFFLLRPLEADVADANRIEFPLGRRQRLSHHILERVRVPTMVSQVVARFPRAIRPERERITAQWDYSVARDEVVVSALMNAVVSPVAFYPLLGSDEGDRTRPGMPSMFDPLPVGTPRFAPDGRTLAFRFGVADAFAPTALWSFEEDSFILVAPNSATRLRGAWNLVTLLSRHARASGGDGPVSFGIDKGLVKGEEYHTLTSARFAPLDLFDLPHRQSQRDADAAEAIDRAATAGLALLAEDEHEGAPWSELRLLFHYLRRDYASALVALEKIDPGLDEGEKKGVALASSMVRLQALWGLGRKEGAKWEWNRLVKEVEKISPDDPAWLGTLGRENPPLAKQFQEVLVRRLTKFERIFAGEASEQEPRSTEEGDRPAAEN